MSDWSQARVGGAPPTVVLIDDDEITGMALSRSMRKKGFACSFLQAFDGDEGVELLRSKTEHSAPRCPFIILLDLNMPGASGFDVLDEIRTEPGLIGAKIFILSSSDNPRDIARAHANHVTGYVFKGIAGDGFDSLVEMLQKFTAVVEAPVH